MKLKIEGKLRDGFFEWLYQTHQIVDERWDKYEKDHMLSDEFSTYPQSAQFGLLQEYADTLGIDIGINKYRDFNSNIDFIWYVIFNDIIERHFADDRPEAQQEAIKKLNEIINKDER